MRLGSADAPRRRGVPSVRSGFPLTSRRVRLETGAGEASQTELTWSWVTQPPGFTAVGGGGRSLAVCSQRAVVTITGRLPPLPVSPVCPLALRRRSSDR